MVILMWPHKPPPTINRLHMVPVHLRDGRSLIFEMYLEAIEQTQTIEAYVDCTGGGREQRLFARRWDERLQIWFYVECG
jgi:hypothetical protein